MLHTTDEVNSRIAHGRPLLLAGSEYALNRLKPGQWIAGTIPYFMDAAGGVCSVDRVFVTELPDYALATTISEYAVENLHEICRDAPENGFSLLILPFGSEAHVAYAQGAPAFEGMYLKPVAGWISGVHLSQIGKQQPKVYDGRAPRAMTDRGIVMHVALPLDKLAEVDTINVFTPGSGDAITFPESGFCATGCRINGHPESFAGYIKAICHDFRLPLTADYNGVIVNVSVQGVEPSSGRVRFYSPVFKDVTYRFAAPINDYLEEFRRSTTGRPGANRVFACNCILNYVHARLEGHPTGTITGPITFGEIAHQLVNQTLVQLRIHDLG